MAVVQLPNYLLAHCSARADSFTHQARCLDAPAWSHMPEIADIHDWLVRRFEHGLATGACSLGFVLFELSSEWFLSSPTEPVRRQAAHRIPHLSLPIGGGLAFLVAIRLQGWYLITARLSLGKAGDLGSLTVHGSSRPLRHHLRLLLQLKQQLHQSGPTWTSHIGMPASPSIADLIDMNTSST